MTDNTYIIIMSCAIGLTVGIGSNFSLGAASFLFCLYFGGKG